jgi:hypothetical protein
VQSSGQSLDIQFFEAAAFLIWHIGILVEANSETDIREQGQGIADIADGKFFHW